ncbi:hypothetical protein GCM10018771_35220 [Streptomyces cellulosae]|nr:hypothetical protein GCM10018771_35220 [Streptomyces cellulosae]
METNSVVPMPNATTARANKAKGMARGNLPRRSRVRAPTASHTTAPDGVRRQRCAWVGGGGPAPVLVVRAWLPRAPACQIPLRVRKPGGTTTRYKTGTTTPYAPRLPSPSHTPAPTLEERWAHAAPGARSRR